MNKPTHRMLHELNLLGYDWVSIHQIYKEKTLKAGVVDIILKWLPEVYTEHLGSGDQLVRSLISASEPFNPFVLKELFEKSSLSDAIKWGIAYVLSISKTTDISDWIKNQLLNEEYLFERSAFIEALTLKANIKSNDELRVFIKKIFDKYKEHESLRKLFKKFGTLDDISFLTSKIEVTDKKMSKEIEKIIVSIQNRKVIHKLKNVI